MKQETILLSIILMAMLFLLSCSKKNGEEVEHLFDEVPSDSSQVAETEVVEKLDQEGSSTLGENAIDDYQKYHDPNGQFVVQVGLFKKLSFAKKLKFVLENRDIPTFIKKISKPTSDLNDNLYYRVRIGPFGTKTDSETFSKIHLGEYYYWIDVIK